jgi:hypothetical protein
VKNFLAVGLLVLSSWAGIAQAGGFGVHGGLNFASGSTNIPGINIQSTTEFMVGAFLEGEVVPVLFIQPEANFTRRGDGLDFLEIPVFLKAKFPVGPVQPYLMAGPEGGVRLSSNANKSFDFGLEFGGGLEFELPAGAALLVEGRYYVGLSNALDTGNPAVATVYGPNASLNYRGIQVLGGIAFRF